MKIDINKIILIIFILFSHCLIAQDSPSKQKVNLNLGLISYFNFNSDQAIEKRLNLKPLAAITLNDKFEIGISYLKLFRSENHEVFESNISLAEQKSFLGYYYKQYLGSNNEFSLQIGYYKLHFDYDSYDFLTGEYTSTPNEITNQRGKFSLYNDKEWLAISCGYSIKISDQVYLEPQVSYHQANEQTNQYFVSINNIADLSSYPDNQYWIAKNGIKKYNEIQFSLTLTYRFTLLK